MSNGPKVLKFSKSRLKSNHPTAKRLGHQPTQNSSDCANAMKASEKAPTEEHTSFFTQMAGNYQSRKNIAADESREALRRSRILSSFSKSECARLDRLGIKILGIRFDIDHNDRSWAE